MEKSEKFKIMLIDDSRASREVITGELKNCSDFLVFKYDNPIKAIEDLDRVKPEFFISDLVMPEMDGFDLCRQIKKNPSYTNKPFILISGYINDEINIKALQVGVTKTIKKPFKPFSVFKFVNQYFVSHHRFLDFNGLIVSDSNKNRYLNKKFFSALKLNVFNAKSAEEGEDILKQNSIDLIFIDKTLHGINGIDWCKKLRTNENFSLIQILGFSESNYDAMSFFQAGADDFLNKQISEQDFAIHITNLLKRVDLTRKLNDSIHKEKVLNKQKNKLLGTAAHDIRNPLSVISAYAQLLFIDHDCNEKQKNYSKIILDTCRQTSRLLNKILDVSSIDSGVINLEKSVFDLGVFIKEQVSLINEIGKNKNIQGVVDCKLKDDVDMSVNADKNRLTQVFDNLFTNALKFSEPGSNFRVILKKQIEGWLIQIADSGKGIPQDELPWVFEEFRKGSVVSTAGEKSTGLGLATVKKIIEIHNGVIWVDSKVGKGTVFSFILPYW